MKGEFSPFGLVNDLLILEPRIDTLAFSVSKGKNGILVLSKLRHVRRENSVPSIGCMSL